MDKNEDTKINCATFQKQEPVINALTERINRTSDVEEKAVNATELQEETDVLLSCADYDGEKVDCENCRFIANLRNKTASLIIKAKNLTQ